MLRDQDDLEELYRLGQTQCHGFMGYVATDGVLFGWTVASGIGIFWHLESSPNVGSLHVLFHQLFVHYKRLQL